MPLTRARLPIVILAAAWFLGCGGGGENTVPVNGKLVDGTKPFALDPGKLKLPAGATGLPPGVNPVQVVFIPTDGGDSHSAVLNTSDGTFTVPGKDGKGIKPGKYKVAITGGVGGADYFGGKFAPDKTQVVKDVQPGQEVVIDVSKPTG